MPTITDELAAVTAAIRGVIEGDRYPHAPRLDPLRSALAKLDLQDGAAPEGAAASPRQQADAALTGVTGF